MTTKSIKPTPLFKRAEVAKILGVTTLTIYNRENRNQYPSPKRDLNNYRVYDVDDIFNLQLLTYGAYDVESILRAIYDKGFTSPEEALKLVTEALGRKTAEVTL